MPGKLEHQVTFGFVQLLADPIAVDRDSSQSGLPRWPGIVGFRPVRRVGRRPRIILPELGTTRLALPEPKRQIDLGQFYRKIRPEKERRVTDG